MIVPRRLLRPERDVVLVLGDAISDAARAEFENRGLRLALLSAAPTISDLNRARGVLIHLDTGRAITELLPRAGASWIDHGLLICVSTADDASQLVASDLLRGLPPDQVERKVLPPAYVFPELLARHDPGPAADGAFTPEYVGNVEPLDDEDHLLMSRALAGYGQVRLEELSPGLSGARVFTVHTTRGNSFGNWGQPLFAKFDRRSKILQEADGYRAAKPFIPFGMCPEIEQVRLGARRGLLVGSLVDQSEALWDVARRGLAATAIFNLFDMTLGAWRAQGLRVQPSNGSMWQALEGARIIRADKIRSEYYETACGRGEALTPEEIVELLRPLNRPHRVGPIHGDLHADNVRVRRGEAILIDMASVCNGPLAADVALLETWFAIALKDDEHNDNYHDPEWEEVVEALYAPNAFILSPPPSEAGMKYRWMWDVIRQLRTIGIANQCSSDEYRLAVVAGLLRRCMFPATCRRDKGRRRTAYRLASRLVEALSAHEETTLATL
ncbi:phosphotransferase [Phenylobacterium soli]|nr:phosphotransferase [Phenylobacterium soli]